MQFSSLKRSSSTASANKSNNSGSSQQQDELDTYLLEDTIYPDNNETFNSIHWWRDNAKRFPNLSKMARAFLAIQASSVASECVFSLGGRVISDQRANLKSVTLRKLVLSQDWLKSMEDYNWRNFAYNYEI